MICRELLRAVNRQTTPRAASVFSCAINLFIAPSSTATAFYRAAHRRTSPRAVPAIHCVVEDCFRRLLYRPELLPLSLESPSTATVIFRRSTRLSLLIVLSRTAPAIYRTVHRRTSPTATSVIYYAVELVIARRAVPPLLLRRRSKNGSKRCFRYLLRRREQLSALIVPPELLPPYVELSRTATATYSTAQNFFSLYFCCQERLLLLLAPPTDNRSQELPLSFIMPSSLYCAVEKWILHFQGHQDFGVFSRQWITTASTYSANDSKLCAATRARSNGSDCQ